MTEPLQVGQFAIVDHEPVDRGPNAGIFHGKGPADDRAELYVVAEGTTPAGESFAGHVVSAIGHIWQSWDISLTGALRQVFIEGERNLREWNQKSIAQHRVSIGLTCFARRGPQAVVAQAGPSVAYHFSNGRLDIHFTDEEHGRPIGAGGPPNPQLTRIDLLPGDRLLLVSTVALRELDDDVVGGILAMPAEKILPELYHRLQELRDVTVVLISEPAARPIAAALVASEEDPDEFVIDATVGGGSALHPEPEEANVFQASLFVEGDRDTEAAVDAARRRLLEVSAESRVRLLAPTVAEEMPIPLRRASGDMSLPPVSRPQNSAGAGTMRPTWRSTAPSPGEIHEAPEPKRRERTGSFSRGLVREGAPLPPPSPGTGDTAPFVEDAARAVRERATTPAPSSDSIAGDAIATVGSGGTLVRMRGDMGGRWKGGGGSRRATTPGGHVPGWAIAAVGMGLLIVLVALLTLPGLIQDSKEDDYLSLVTRAQEDLAAAGVQPDPGLRRDSLEEAQALLLQARDSDDAGPEVDTIMANVDAALSELDAITAPAAVEAVADLSQFGPSPVTVSRLVGGSTNVYLLDSTSSQVIRVPLDGTAAETVFAESQESGHGRPIAVAFLDTPPLGGAAAVIADANGAMWFYRAEGGLAALTFAAPEGLSITDMAGEEGFLYILDANEGVVWRFIPSGNGFDTAPSEALRSTDLSKAHGLMVKGDSIVTSDRDGTLRYFGTDSAFALSLAGIDEPLVAGEPPQAFGDAGEIAVLDPPNNRIVVVQREGTFERQYRHADFEGLGAFAIGVDGMGYIFNGGQLRRITW